MKPSRSSLRRLGSGAAIYGIATLIGRAASMIMLPVYTHLLTPGDYGILQMLDLSVEVLSIFLSAGATAGVMRFYYVTDDVAARKRLLTSAFVMLFALEAVGAALLAILAPSLVERLLGPSGRASMIVLASANFMMGSLIAMPLLQYQIEERAQLFAVTSVVKLISQLSLNVLFLVKFKMGPIGILWSTFITSLLVGGFCTIKFIAENGWRISLADASRLKRFAIPYQITAAGGFLLTFGDRFFLKRYESIAAVGLYGLAYQFGFLLIMVTSGPILQAWTPIRHQEAQLPRAERDALFNRNLLLLTGITVAGALGMSLFAAPALRVIVNREYWEAANIIPVVALAFVVRSWSDSYHFFFDISEQPRFVAIGTWSAVALIAGLFVVLIPRFGTMGAAASVCLAFAFRLGLYWYFAQRVWPSTLRWHRHAILLGLAVAAYSANRLINSTSLPGQFATASAAFGVFAAVAWLMLPAGVRRALVTMIHSRGRAAVAFAVRTS